MLQEINKNIAKLAPKMSVANNNGLATDVSRIPSAKSTVSFKTKKEEETHPKKATQIQTTSSAPSRSSHANIVALKEKNSKNLSHQIKRELNSSSSDFEYEFREVQKRQTLSDTEDEPDLESVTSELCRQIKENRKGKDKAAAEKVNFKDAKSTTSINEFKREIINEDGSKDIWYSNGNLKKISADAMNIRMLYFNKDIKETNVNEGTVKYYYAESNTWHTTYLDGLEILEFPNGQTEHRHKNGVVEVHFPDSSIKVVNPTDKHKQEEWRFANGTNLIQMRNGDKILMLPNGQKEIHTKLNKRREYPDGTVKLVYPDGSQETRYSNGRVRLKDKDGNLIMDSQNI